MSHAINRRDFLTVGGATIAGVTLGEAGRRLLARADERAASWHEAAVDTWATSVCRECSAACGTRVRLRNGTPIKIDGNPACPISRGRLCAKGQAAVESYFDPDRLIGPARRIGPRGSGKWERIGWDDAIGRLTGALGKTTPVVALGAEEHGALADVWTRFWTTRGARIGWALSPTPARLAPRLAALTAADGQPIFDLEHATHVLSFGAPIVEDWLSPVWSQRSYGRFRRGPSRPRGHLVQIEARRSLTARKADEWLPVLAADHAALAYGLASVLLREGRVDTAFLDEFGGNVADFERDVVARFTPDAVAVATGVPVVTLLRLARDLMASRQPLVVVAADAPPNLIDATLALNALIGAFDRPGGVYLSPARMPAATGPSGAIIAEIADLSTHVGVVAFRDAAPLRAFATPHDLGPAFDRCDLVVSFSPYLDEAAAVADLLLPTHTALESWHAVVPAAADPTEKIACARPAAAPRLDTRDLVSVLNAAAAALGGQAAAAVPWKSSGEVVTSELDRLWSLRRGAPYATAFETEWVRQLEGGGWWVPPAASGAEFRELTLRSGGWVDPFFAPGQIRQSLTRRRGLSFVPAAPSSGDAALEPAAAGASREWPVAVTAFTPAVVNLAGGPNQPVLFELLGQPDSAPWRVWAELGPETARQFGIEHGATIRISSAAGSIDALAMVVEGMPAGTVQVAFVPAVAPAGRWATFLNADARRLWPRGATTAAVAARIARI